MSLNNNDIKNEIHPTNLFSGKNITKEMLKELLKNQLNQRLLKLESSTKEHISNLNYTSKYFTEFTKAIQQFSKFFEESETLKEKEKDLLEKKESTENNNDKFIAKKSNESTSSTNTSKNFSKNNQNKKLENSLKTRNNTQSLFKAQKLKKQATTLSLAKNIFSNKMTEDKKINKQKQKIFSPDTEKKINNKTNNIMKEGGKNGTPPKNQKSNHIFERNSINFKTPKTEVKNKAGNKLKILKNNNRNKSQYNLSELKNENEKYKTMRDNFNTSKYMKQKALNKTSNKNPKNNNKNKKQIKFNIQNNNDNNIDDFSKTLTSHFINKTIELDTNKDYEKRAFLNSSLSTKKKRKIRLNHDPQNTNINDIANIVKLVDDVNQNITKLLESNERLNNNKTLMVSSLDLNNPNKTFMESNYRSTVNLFNNKLNQNSDNLDKKGTLIKKKQNNYNISLYKDNDNNNNEINKDLTMNESNKINIENTPIKTEFSKFLNNISARKLLTEDYEENKRYQTVNNSFIKDRILKENLNVEDNNKLEKETNINIDIIEIFKNDKKILKNIFKYLKEMEIIIFTSSNNYLNKERISLLDNKKEELLQILNLQKDETMENKIKRIKKEFSDEQISQTPDGLVLSDDARNKLKELNNDENIQIFKNELDKNDKDFNLIIILYKIIFILLDIEEIYSVVNDDIFWEKCRKFLIENTDGQFGDYILGKISAINFDSKCVNTIEILIKDKKENLINDLSNNNKFLVEPFIKEAFEYCGIIFDPKKTQGSIIIKNLKNNQMVINYLNNLKVRYFLAKYEEEEDDDDDD